MPTRFGITNPTYNFGSEGVSKIYQGTSLVFIKLSSPEYYSRSAASAYSINFRVRNNNDVPVTVSYGVTSSASSFTTTLAAGALSANITISGLSPSTTYAIYVKFIYATTENQSAIVNLGNVTTLSATPKTATPTISNITFGQDFNNFPYYMLTYRVYNNDSSTADLYSQINTTNYVNRGATASGAYKTVTYYNLTNTRQTIYAKAQASGKDESDVVTVLVN